MLDSGVLGECLGIETKGIRKSACELNYPRPNESIVKRIVLKEKDKQKRARQKGKPLLLKEKRDTWKERAQSQSSNWNTGLPPDINYVWCACNCASIH